MTQTHDAGWQYLHDLDAKNRGVDSSGLTGVSAAAAQYPAFASLMAIPEISGLLNQAAQEGWTNDQFTLHLMESHWWKSKSDTERVWEATKLSDPAKAAQQKTQMITQVTNEAGLLGVTLDANQAQFIAEGAIGQGWNAAQLQAAIAGNAQQCKDSAGTIAATQTALNGIASQFAMPVSSHATFDWAKRIAMGQTNQAAFQEWAKNQSILQHPYWQKEIEDGATVRQLADPYIQIAARTLELSPDQIDLSDPKWQKALQQRDAQGKVTGPMSHLDWTRTLMQDPHYGYDRTDNAKQAAYSMVDQLGKTFGATK